MQYEFYWDTICAASLAVRLARPAGTGTIAGAAR
jgi:hypothetical protein